MENLLSFSFDIMQSPHLLLMALTLSICIKAKYLIQFFNPKAQIHTARRPLYLLICIILCATLNDISWLLKTYYTSCNPSISYAYILGCIRIAWGAHILQYLSLALFLQSLVNPRIALNRWYQLLIGCGLLSSSYFIYTACIKPYLYTSIKDRAMAFISVDGMEQYMMLYITPLLVGLFCTMGIGTALYYLSKKNLPNLLIKQLKLFLIFFVTPFFCIEFILALCFQVIMSLPLLISASTLMLALGIDYCLRNVIKLRFANRIARVEGLQSKHLFACFKTVLKALSEAQSRQELSHITQVFFKEAFDLPSHAIKLIICSAYHDAEKDTLSESEKVIEEFLRSETITDQFATSIYVFDELEFTYFYLQSPHLAKQISLFKTYNIDTIVPIYSKKLLVGYIIVDRSNPKKYFNHAEQDAMLAYATYAGNIINLLNNRNIQTLIYTEKKLKDTLYKKHQKINQYKESINSFLRHSKEKKLGIVFYKAHRFIYANNEARLLLPVDPNKQEGHPITKALRQLAQQVETFNTPNNLHIEDGLGNRLLLSAVPHLMEKHIIITVSHPDVSDVIIQQMHVLHDPNDWDYLLYLSSTKAGQLITQFIPGDSDILLNTKVSLLKSALGIKAILLEAPEEDVIPTAQLIHTISDKNHMHILTLSGYMDEQESATTLFGSAQAEPHISLLEKCKNGTLFIKNIHHVHIMIQEKLAEYIRYGRYTKYHSHEYIESNARIICSTHHNISELIRKGKFSPKLYELLKKEIIMIPSPGTLPESEKKSFISSYADTFIHAQAAKSLLALSDRDTQLLLSMDISSFSHLKQSIESIILKKTETLPYETTKKGITSFDDPHLLYAAQLGKKALKNDTILELLWNKFKSQTKIAQFLGVNRSSVNRRFKEFHIGEHSGETA